MQGSHYDLRTVSLVTEVGEGRLLERKRAESGRVGVRVCLE